MSEQNRGGKARGSEPSAYTSSPEFRYKARKIQNTPRAGVSKLALLRSWPVYPGSLSMESEKVHSGEQSGKDGSTNA